MSISIMRGHITWETVILIRVAPLGELKFGHKIGNRQKPCEQLLTNKRRRPWPSYFETRN